MHLPNTLVHFAISQNMQRVVALDMLIVSLCHLVISEWDFTKLKTVLYYDDMAHLIKFCHTGRAA